MKVTLNCEQAPEKPKPLSLLTLDHTKLAMVLGFFLFLLYDLIRNLFTGLSWLHILLFQMWNGFYIVEILVETTHWYKNAP